MSSLSNGRGYVEILADAGGEPKDRRRQAHMKCQYRVYFYEPDGTTVMSPPPSDVRLTIGAAEHGMTVAFSLPAKSQEEAAPGSLVSPVGSFPTGFQGQLEAKVNGEPVTAEILIR